MPGVSVVIPAYNYANFLGATMDSVLRQEYPQFELIVVDDGSTDDTHEVVESRRRLDSRVRYVHQTNAGLSAARNTGIRSARHGFVAFLDADDQWLPGFLARTMQTFARLPENFFVVAARNDNMDVKGELIKTKKLAPQEDVEITARDVLFRTRFGSSSVVVKRAAFEQCGYFDTTLRSSEDRHMWLRIAARHRIFLLAERLAVVRRHPTSMSRDADRMKDNMGRVLRYACQNDIVPRREIFFWLRVYSFFYFQTAWMYGDQCRRGKALRDLLFSLLLWPCFFRPGRFNEPPLFRIRSFIWFVRRKNRVAEMPPPKAFGVAPSVSGQRAA